MPSFCPKKSIFSCFGSSYLGAATGAVTTAATGADVFSGIEIGLTSGTGLDAGADDLSSRSLSPQSAE